MWGSWSEGWGIRNILLGNGAYCGGSDSSLFPAFKGRCQIDLEVDEWIDKIPPMPFRFYRRVTIAPGLTLNRSKGGISVSGGIPGEAPVL